MQPSILQYNANTYIHSTVYEHSTTSSLFPFSGGDSLCIAYVRMYLTIGVLNRMYVLYMLYVLHVLYMLCVLYVLYMMYVLYVLHVLFMLHVLYVLYVCSSPVDCAVLISAQDDVLQSIDTAIQQIYDEAAANNGMMSEQQRKMLAYVVHCVCFVVRVQCTAVYVQYATVYIRMCIQQCTYICTMLSTECTKMTT